jgi:hypothetical protein
MDEINFDYEAPDGTKREIALSDSRESIRLKRYRMNSIDLSPVRYYPSLKTLILSINGIRHLDLSPLSSCKQLRKLHLDGNQLVTIDLTPLSSCPQLEELRLDWSLLEEVDLTPLSSCEQLKSLLIGSNPIRDVNLYPLATCPQLEEVGFNRTYLNTVDITPLVACPHLKDIWAHHGTRDDLCITFLSESTVDEVADFRFRTIYSRSEPRDIYLREYDVPVPIRNLDPIRTLYPIVREYEPDWKRLHLVQCISEIVGVEWLGFLDIDTKKFEVILYEEDTSKITSWLVEEFCKQLDKDGTTVGADLGRIKDNSNPEIALRLPDMLELRRREIDEIILKINKDDNAVNLEPLWLTAYGFQILSEMELDLSCTIPQFDQVRRVISEADISIEASETTETNYPSTEMSESMHEYIIRLAKFD